MASQHEHGCGPPRIYPPDFRGKHKSARGGTSSRVTMYGKVRGALKCEVSHTDIDPSPPLSSPGLRTFHMKCCRARGPSRSGRRRRGELL